MKRWNPDQVRINVARDLRAIVDYYHDLPAHAETEGDPTSEAVLMLGHVANPEAFNYRLDAARDTSHAADQFEADLLYMLATWEDLIREERDQPTDLRATVERAADYLRESITWCLSNDEDGNMHFLGIDRMAEDIAKAKAHLENLLHAGDRSDRGVPCLRCATALVKDWGECDERCEPRAEGHEPESHDRWRCPNAECPVEYVDGAELGLAIKNTARQYAEWLTGPDMEIEYRVPASTVRRWASGDEPTVRKKRDINVGLMVYNVADVKEQRDAREIVTEDEPAA